VAKLPDGQPMNLFSISGTDVVFLLAFQNFQPGSGIHADSYTIKNGRFGDKEVGV